MKQVQLYKNRQRLVDFIIKHCTLKSMEKTTHFSSTFMNGVRQGGILSSGVFAVYADDLSTQLNGSRAKCFIEHLYDNHVMYAVDICLSDPSAIELQRF